MFKKTDVNREELMNEVKILSKLNHPNIVKYRTARENSKYIFIEMELLKGGTLKEFM
jgi:serine/threonine protein kinase